MVTPAQVREAASRLQGAVVRTPCERSRTLSALTGADVWLKFENRQFTASFKERGALNCLLSLDETVRRRGVICMSAGNHAQGVAYHAQRLGIAATIVMPASTPFVKVEQTRHFEPRIVLEGDDLASAAKAAQDMAAAEGLYLIHPYDDPLVIAGQGTVALEMLETRSDFDDLVVPVGGGGLIAGMAVAAKDLNPDIRLTGVETELFPSMAEALAGDARPYRGITLAEGIAVANPGRLTLPIVRALVDDIVIIPEASIETAILQFLEIEKTVVEGAGAAGLAAMLKEPGRFKGRKVGLVVTGGNIDSRMLSSIILRGLAREGRLMRLLVEIADLPGNLAQVASLIGRTGANIVDVYHERYFSQFPIRSTALIVVLETRSSGHGAEIMESLTAQGFKCRWVPFVQ